MTSKLEQHTDKLAKKSLKSLETEVTSTDFTAKVMSKIASKNTNVSSVAYKPLISKTGWLSIIGLLVLVPVLMTMLGGENTWFGGIDYSFVYDNKLSQLLSGLSLSKTMVYAIVLFGFFWMIQIPLLKHYHERQMKL